MDEDTLQHQKQIQHGKQIVEQILLGVAGDIGLHLDEVKWEEKGFDVRSPVRGIGTATPTFHHLSVRVGEQWGSEQFSSDELADLPETKEMHSEIRVRVTILLTQRDLRERRIGF